MKSFAIILSILLSLTLFAAGCDSNIESPTSSDTSPSKSDSRPDSDSTTDPKEPSPTPKPDLRTTNLIALGNVFPHMPQIEQAYIGDGKYDFSPSFEFIAPRLQKGDLVVADLETAQAGPDISFIGYSGYTAWPTFNSPGELTVAMKDAGINMVTLANNHALDRGFNGLKSTLDHVRGLGIKTFGAYKTQEERDTPLIINSNGIDIAFIGYTFSTNGIPEPEGYEFCVNHVPFFRDYTPLVEDIKNAKAHGADIIAVFPHWGENEHTNFPQAEYRDIAADLAYHGADLIIGGHPKYTQPFEWFFNETPEGGERATMAIYSQGNFLCNQHYPALPSPFVEYHVLLDIGLTKDMDTGEAWISKMDYEVTWIHRLWRHRILPLNEVFSGNPEDFNLSSSKMEELKTWEEKVIQAAEAYNHKEGKSRAMSISEEMFQKAGVSKTPTYERP